MKKTDSDHVIFLLSKIFGVIVALYTLYGSILYFGKGDGNAIEMLLTPIAIGFGYIFGYYFFFLGYVFIKDMFTK